VFFIARLGSDIFGTQSMENFKQVGIHTKYIEQMEGVPSGIALIAIDEKGKNSIIVVPGANGKLSPADVDKAKSDIARAGVVVAQLEVPLETVEHTAALARDCGVPFILDPAPARPLSPVLLSRVSILKPNEIEAEMLTGIKVRDIDSAKKAAGALLAQGIKQVIITLGDRGFLLAADGSMDYIKPHKVRAVDSTAAGDAFTGALALGIADGKDIRQAALFANAVAAVSVTRLGAQSSMPTREEVETFLSR
jgi:ribokinase